MAHNSPPGRREVRRWVNIDQAADTVRPQPTMSIALGGNLGKLRSAMIPRPTQVPSARGPITRFSAAARKRLVELLASIDQGRTARLPLFVTLTYPGEWPDDPGTWKRHLDTWGKRLARKFTRTSAVWKLEFQSRGAPHFHLLVFGPRWIDPLWLARSWFKTVGSGDPRHLVAGTQVVRVKSWRGVMFYASKYLGKVGTDRSLQGVGRFWGVVGREFLPIEFITVPLTFGQFYSLRRLLIRWTQGPPGERAANEKISVGCYRHRIRGEHQGMTVFREAARVLQTLRLVAR